MEIIQNMKIHIELYVNLPKPSGSSFKMIGKSICSNEHTPYFRSIWK